MPEPEPVAPVAPLAPHASPDPHELLRDASATLDADGRVRGWNAAAAMRFGVRPPDAVGRSLEELGAPGADPSLARLPLARGGTLAVWHADEPPGNEQILLAKARALEFLAGPVRHDLSNPLNALLLFASLVKLEGGVPEDMTGEMDAVAEAAGRAHRLMSLDLELMRHRAAVVAPVRPATLVGEVLDLAGYLLVDVDTAVDVPEDLPDAEADPGGVRLALVLVLLNAVRALGGPKATGRLWITGRVVGQAAAIEIVVADDAAGVSAEERPHLFDALPPVRAGRAGADLAVARTLLRRDSGELRFESGPDGANRFVLAVPQLGHQASA